MSLLSVENCTKGFNDRVLLDGVSLAIGDGERVGLVGANGSGKSTLLQILAGIETPEEGTRVARRGLDVGYLEQEPVLDADKTVREVVRLGLDVRERVLARLERVHEDLGSATGTELERLLAREASLTEELERLGGHDVEHKVESTLQALGLSDFDARADKLSGGERRRVALARLLLRAPDLLLLDEPTNHLDAFVTSWLEDWFLETRTPLLLVTHDRYFLDRVVDRIVELDRGSLHSYEGGYGEYLEARAARLAAEGKAESARLNLLRRETAWMRRGPPARTTKAKARIRRYDALVDGEPTKLADDLELTIPPGPRLGTRVLNLAGVAKRFGDQLVLPPLDLELEPGMRLGIVGPNGAGKSTLVRILLGDLQSDEGTREVGDTVVFMGIDQMRTELDPTLSVAETVAGRSDVVLSGDRTVRVQSFLDRFGFPTAMQQSRISQLSGGEKNRVLLAKLFCAGGNVVVLDEPTNDLDLATLRALEEALIAFPGVAVVVSHDRWFLDRVATRVLYLDGRGGARLHHGDVSGLLDRLASEAHAEAKPKKTTPKAAKPASSPKKKRLTPWQERELGELEEKIPEVEGAIAELDERLGDPALYSGSGTEVAEIQSKRGALETELAALYERWEELESLR